MQLQPDVQRCVIVRESSGHDCRTADRLVLRMFATRRRHLPRSALFLRINESFPLLRVLYRTPTRCGCQRIGMAATTGDDEGDTHNKDNSARVGLNLRKSDGVCPPPDERPSC